MLLQSDWESQNAVYTLFWLGFALPAQVQYLFINNVDGLSQERVNSLRAYTHFFLRKPIIQENMKRTIQIVEKLGIENITVTERMSSVGSGGTLARRSLCSSTWTQ